MVIEKRATENGPRATIPGLPGCTHLRQQGNHRTSRIGNDGIEIPGNTRDWATLPPRIGKDNQGRVRLIT